MVESETPPQASPPHAADDTEVLSQRTSLGQGEVRRAAETKPEGNTSAAGNMGGIIPMETDGGGLDQSGPQPNTAPEPLVVPDSVRRPPVKRRKPPVTVASVHPEAPDNLLEALRSASIDEEHRTIMSAVIQKVQSAKSGLTEACASLLTGFEVSVLKCSRNITT